MDFGKIYPSVASLAEKLPTGKNVYAKYTCAIDDKRNDSQNEKIAKETGCALLGEYGCRGYNTYGPWKILGEMNKSNTNQDELEGECLFYERITALLQNQ